MTTNLSTKLNEMYNLQNQFNSAVSNDWIEIRTIEDWTRAIWLECAELVESLPWKWWRSSEPDMRNVKIELVDVLHMVLSYVLIHDHKRSTGLRKYFEEQLLKYPTPDSNSKFNSDELIRGIESTAAKFLTERPHEALDAFAQSIYQVMDFDQLHALYVGKNMLNELRRTNGYKEGKYKKIIDGREDNEYLMDFVEQGLNIEEVESKLKTIIAKGNKTTK